MKRSKKELDDECIQEGNLLRCRSVIYITATGGIRCTNKRLEWIAIQYAKGGWYFSTKLGVYQLRSSHRLPNRTYKTLIN